jgi:hypothetical protein
MADSSIAITAGSGTNVDTRTEGTNGNHRQVVVLGDPATNAGVAPVDATNGLAVDVKQSALPTGAATSAKQDTGNTSLASIDGKITAVDTNNVTISAALPAGTNAIGKLAANSGVDIGDVDVTSVTPGTTASSLGKAEDAAHSTGDVGVMSLGVRNDANASLSGTDLDYTPLSVDASGRQIILPFATASAQVFGNATTTNTSDTSLVAASGDAGLRTYITDLTFVNTGSNTSLITVKDGSGGSTLWYAIVPPGAGYQHTFNSPIRTTANTALYFAAGTASTTIYGSASGYKAP